MDCVLKAEGGRQVSRDESPCSLIAFCELEARIWSSSPPQSSPNLKVMTERALDKPDICASTPDIRALHIVQINEPNLTKSVFYFNLNAREINLKINPPILN